MSLCTTLDILCFPQLQWHIHCFFPSDSLCTLMTVQILYILQLNYCNNCMRCVVILLLKIKKLNNFLKVTELMGDEIRIQI